MGTERLKDRKRIIELIAMLVLAGIIVWQYGSLAPRVIIVLSFFLSLVVALLQLPFLAGYYGIRRFRPALIVLLSALPFLIALGFSAVYHKNLFLIWYGEWLGSTTPATAAAVTVALPVLAYLFGRLGMKIRRTQIPSFSRRERMPTFIETPSIIKAAGNKPKVIEEYIGRVNSKTDAVSIARMQSPPGWAEPGQTPEFDEYTVVLRGMLRVETREGIFNVGTGQAIIMRKGDWVRYSSPGPDGAEYVAVCLPAFTPETVHREG
jgi:mannose-6-phosphate isomerase-like protein (cupin superfamily)